MKTSLVLRVMVLGNVSCGSGVHKLSLFET